MQLYIGSPPDRKIDSDDTVASPSLPQSAYGVFDFQEANNA